MSIPITEQHQLPNNSNSSNSSNDVMNISDKSHDSSSDSSFYDDMHISYDAEWLAIMRKTHHLLNTTRGAVRVPDLVTPVSVEVN